MIRVIAPIDATITEIQELIDMDFIEQKCGRCSKVSYVDEIDYFKTEWLCSNYTNN